MLCSISPTLEQVPAENIFVSDSNRDFQEGRVCLFSFAGNFKLVNSNHFKYGRSNKLTDAFKSTRRDVFKLVLPFISVGVVREKLKALQHI